MELFIKRKDLRFVVAKCLRQLSAHLQVQMKDSYILDNDDERDILINISPNEFGIIYSNVSSYAEGIANVRNSNLDTFIQTQLITLIGNGDLEAVETVNVITAIKQSNAEIALLIENQGDNLLINI